MESTDLHPGMCNLITANQDGQVIAAELNTQNHDSSVPKGQRYGTFTRTCAPEEWGEMPWRICSISPPEKRQDSRKDYIKKFIQASKEDYCRRKTGSANIDPKDPGLAKEQKGQWIQEAFKLQDSPFLQTLLALHAATEVLMEFWDLFSHDGSFGKTHLMTHRIITEDVPPIKCPK